MVHVCAVSKGTTRPSPSWIALTLVDVNTTATTFIFIILPVRFVQIARFKCYILDYLILNFNTLILVYFSNVNSKY
jgi:hypothetical protein